MERYRAKEATITKQQARTLMQDETSGTSYTNRKTARSPVVTERTNRQV
jgi:hypothetical protein